MIESLLKQHSETLIAAVTQGSQLDAGQAEQLVPPAITGLQETLSSGDLDLSSLLGGGGLDISSLVSGGALGEILGKLDIGHIASQAGLGEGEARDGLASLIPVAVSLLGERAGGLQGLVGLLGGDSAGSGDAVGGALRGLAGKLFGK